eukprot:GHVR01026727.1.p1 GENE.GHVR01026727.1~~GHVR01026727.1.p1  ORF type:complete len:221 (-),score=20.18 GHVR01026727.1:334-996(-)
MMEVGSIEFWQCGENNYSFVKRFSKGYPKEATTVTYDKASKRVSLGLDDGVIDVILVTNNGYEDIACVKTHQNRVTGVSYDNLSNVTYSISQDKVFRISHGSSLALIVGIPHKEQLLCMVRDTMNKRIFIGTKGGEVCLYDISHGEKPKLLNSLANNHNGSIRSMHFDTNRNYLFTGSYDDGEINVFDLDKPGKEKLAKMNATLKGKDKIRDITWSAKRN